MDTKKLRQKILDLAIQGKLVPQDPDDEPASVLLERIQAEKQQMVKDGKLKAKDIKNDTIIFKGEDNLHYEKFQDGTVKCIEEEIPFEVPEGWEWCRLQSICSVLTDGTHKTPTYSDDGYIFLSSKNVVTGVIDWDNIMYIPEKLHNKLYERLAPQLNDILLAKNGTTGIAAIVDRDCIFDLYVSLALIRILEEIILPQYILIVIGSSYVQGYFNNSLKGIGVSNLHLEHIRKTLVSVPPYQEQLKIVQNANEIMSLCNKIEYEKNDISQLLLIIKSKILNLAIHGKLVPQDSNDEPASVLLERIRAEKEELIKQGKIKRDKKESIIFKGDDNSYYEKFTDGTKICIDEEISFDIPNNWNFCRLSVITIKEIKRGKTPKYIDNSNVKVFAQKCNLKAGGINLEFARFLDETNLIKYNNEEFMQYGDVVINSTGTGTLGRVGYYDIYDSKVVPDSHVTIVRTSEKINKEYIYLFLKSMQSYLEKSGEGSTNQKELKPNTIKQLIIPIPPIEEQKSIINYVNNIFNKLSSLEKNLD